MKKVLLIARAKTTRAIESAEAFADRIRTRIGDDIEIYTSEISELFFELSSDEVAIYHPEKKFDIRDFDLVIIRHIGAYAVEAHAITQYCEYFSIPYTDKYLNRLLLDNKLSTEFLLWFNGVKSWPRTFYGPVDELASRLSELGEKAVLKDNEGSKGRLNFIVSSQEQLRSIAAENPEKHFVLQEFIPNDGDLRVLIFNNEPALVIERTGNGSSHLNNTSQGGDARIVPIKDVDSEILEMSIRAAELTKLQVAGVDVMTDSRSGKHYLLEVNNAPQISSGSFIEEKADEYSRMIRRLIDDESSTK